MVLVSLPLICVFNGTYFRSIFRVASPMRSGSAGNKNIRFAATVTRDGKNGAEIIFCLLAYLCDRVNSVMI